jgi:hypothetical protein
MKYPNPLRPYKAQIMLGLILGLIALAASCFAQDVVCDGKAKIQAIVNLPNATGEEVFKQAARVAALNLSNVNSIPFELITGDGFKKDGAVLSKLPSVTGDLRYRCLIDVKDEKVRVTLTEIFVVVLPNTFTAEKYLCKSDNTLRNNSQSRALTESIQLELKKIADSFNTKKSDW